ncbi:hypothetical protein [Aminobacter aminovorans]|uniref:hypothetical protein n=1 Tax=Aminobacter aminovorans TaxID=83263 RepID=UPI00147184B4|nr:hypothetical protein [Aminobacter aminovorans]
MDQCLDLRFVELDPGHGQQVLGLSGRETQVGCLQIGELTIQLHGRNRQSRLRSRDDQQSEVSRLWRKQQPRQRRIVFLALGEMIVVEEQVERTAQSLQLGQDDPQNMLLRQAGIILSSRWENVGRSENSEQSEQEMGAVAIVAIERCPGRLMASFA